MFRRDLKLGIPSGDFKPAQYVVGTATRCRLRLAGIGHLLTTLIVRVLKLLATHPGTIWIGCWATPPISLPQTDRILGQSRPASLTSEQYEASNVVAINNVMSNHVTWERAINKLPPLPMYPRCAGFYAGVHFDAFKSERSRRIPGAPVHPLINRKSQSRALEIFSCCREG